jgi:hypothetical protein
MRTHTSHVTRHQLVFIHQLRLNRAALLDVAANFSTSNKNSLIYLVTCYQLQILKSIVDSDHSTELE